MNENDGSLSLDQLVEDDLFADFFGVTALALENGRGPQIWLAGDPEDLPDVAGDGHGWDSNEYGRAERDGAEVRSANRRGDAISRHHGQAGGHGDRRALDR